MQKKFASLGSANNQGIIVQQNNRSSGINNNNRNTSNLGYKFCMYSCLAATFTVAAIESDSDQTISYHGATYSIADLLGGFAAAFVIAAIGQIYLAYCRQPENNHN